MIRNISSEQRRELRKRSTSGAFLTFLELEHDGGVDRFVNDRESHVLDGETYNPFTFSAHLPDDLEERTADVRIRFFNVDLKMTEILRAQGVEPPTLRMFVASSIDDFATVLIGPARFQIKSAQVVSVSEVQVRAGYEPVLRMPFPKRRITPQHFPALWKVQ